MIKRVVFVCLALACPFYGQTSAHRISQVIQKAPHTTIAEIVPFARVLICTDDAACSGVQVYQDPELTVTYAQPLTADANGNYNYYIAPGCYKEQILTPGTPVRIIPGVCLAAPRGEGTGTVSSVSVTSANGFTGTVATPDSTPAISIDVDADHHLPTTADVATWTSKQDALGYTPENVANKGVVNGYASLDINTKVPATQLPLATTEDFGAVKPDGTTITISGGVITAIGGGGGGLVPASQAPSGAIDGSNTTFTLSNAPVLLFLDLNGLQMTPGVDYSLTGTTITMTTIPQTGDSLFASYFYGSSTTQNPFSQIPTGTIDGSNTAFTLTHAPVILWLTRNGMGLTAGTDYTISGTAITMTTAPISGDVFYAQYFY